MYLLPHFGFSTLFTFLYSLAKSINTLLVTRNCEKPYVRILYRFKTSFASFVIARICLIVFFSIIYLFNVLSVIVYLSMYAKHVFFFHQHNLRKSPQTMLPVEKRCEQLKHKTALSQASLR